MKLERSASHSPKNDPLKNLQTEDLQEVMGNLGKLEDKRVFKYHETGVDIMEPDEELETGDLIQDDRDSISETLFLKRKMDSSEPKETQEKQAA